MPFPMRRRGPRWFGGLRGLSGLFGGIGNFLPKVMNMWGRVRSIWSMIGPLRTMMKSLLAR